MTLQYVQLCCKLFILTQQVLSVLRQILAGDFSTSRTCGNGPGDIDELRHTPQLCPNCPLLCFRRTCCHNNYIDQKPKLNWLLFTGRLLYSRPCVFRFGRWPFDCKQWVISSGKKKWPVVFKQVKLQSLMMSVNTSWLIWMTNCNLCILKSVSNIVTTIEDDPQM